jgi:hypothetical protein
LMVFLVCQNMIPTTLDDVIDGNDYIAI